MLTDHDLRVRAIRRRERIDVLLGKFIFEAPCKWTKAGRAKHAQWNRVWPRVRDDYECIVGPLNAFQMIRGYVYESAADLHVVGCRCGRCPTTPKRRMSKRATAIRAHAGEEGA